MNDAKFQRRTKEFLTNRPKIDPEELSKHQGQWIAISLDGTRVVAYAEEPDELVKKIESAGANPEEHWLEYIDREPERL